MNLQIRDPRARKLARDLADLEGVSMTDAVVSALEDRLERLRGKEDVVALVERIAEDLRKKGKPGGRDLTKDEIGELWTDAC